MVCQRGVDPRAVDEGLYPVDAGAVVAEAEKSEPDVSITRKDPGVPQSRGHSLELQAVGIEAEVLGQKGARRNDALGAPRAVQADGEVEIDLGRAALPGDREVAAASGYHGAPLEAAGEQVDRQLGGTSVRRWEVVPAPIE